MKCPECNAELINSTSLHFCPVCGAKITNTPSKTVAPKLQLKATNPMELSQQDDIQKDNNISELTFDSEKTAAEIKNTIKYSSGDTREELIRRIEFSENALKKMNSLEAEIIRLDKMKQKSEADKDNIKRKYHDFSIEFLICLCLVSLFFVGGIGFLISRILFAKLEIVKNIVFISSLIIAVLIPILSEISDRKKIKKEMGNKTVQDMLDANQKKIDGIEANIKGVKRKAREYIFSEEWKKAESFLPRDYFYPAAMEKMKFFLINGHADSMKEAVKLYDEYLHREKLEYEAKRAADEAQRTADMSEVTAIAASEASEYAKIIKEQNDSIEFWTRMNTYVTSEIYQTLK